MKLTGHGFGNRSEAANEAGQLIHYKNSPRRVFIDVDCIQ